jgi:hypothetical protein
MILQYEELHKSIEKMLSQHKMILSAGRKRGAHSQVRVTEKLCV